MKNWKALVISSVFPLWIIIIFTTTVIVLVAGERLNEGDPAPFPGYLISDDQQDKILTDRAELDSLKQQLALMQTEIDQLRVLSGLQSEEIEMHKEIVKGQKVRIADLEKQVRYLERPMGPWKKAGYFAAGVAT